MSSQMGAKYRRWEEQMLFVSLDVLGKPLSTSQGPWQGARFCMLTSMPQHFHLSSSPCNSIPLHLG